MLGILTISPKYSQGICMVHLRSWDLNHMNSKIAFAWDQIPCSFTQSVGEISAHANDASWHEQNLISEDPIPQFR